MKALFLALLVVAFAVHPAEARYRHGLFYKATHLGILHKAAKVVGAPFYAAGMVSMAVGGLVALPFMEAVHDFQSRPFVSF